MELVFEASAPGRCGILGNPSDIYGGAVVSCSLPARAYCRLTCGVRDSLPDDLTLWNAVTARYPLENVRVEWRTEVPRSAGLSGSTAFLAATLACVLAARNERPDLDTTHGRSEFAELVRDIERYEAGIVCGFQDAYMICHGGLNAMSFPGKRPDQPQGPRALVAPLQAELPFLLVTTGVERLSGSVHGPMAQRWLDGDAEVISAMERIAEAGREAPSLMQSGNWDRMAELMTENHRRVAELGGSGEAIDRLIAECMDSGASAAKLAGAGLGGTVIALTRHPDRLEAELRAKGYDRFIRPQIADGVRYESLPLEGNR